MANCEIVTVKSDLQIINSLFKTVNWKIEMGKREDVYLHQSYWGREKAINSNKDQYRKWNKNTQFYDDHSQWMFCLTQRLPRLWLICKPVIGTSENPLIVISDNNNIRLCAWCVFVLFSWIFLLLQQLLKKKIKILLIWYLGSNNFHSWKTYKMCVINSFFLPFFICLFTCLCEYNLDWLVSSLCQYKIFEYFS